MTPPLPVPPRLLLLALVIGVISPPAATAAPTPDDWKALDALLAAKDTPAALAKLDALASAHSDTPELAALRDKLRASYKEAIASALLHANQRPRVAYPQLPGLAQVQYSLLENRFKSLAEKPDHEAARTLLADVKTFMLGQPDFLTGWLLQSRLALLLNDPLAGLGAGIHLSQLRAWETTSPETVKLLEILTAKGWLPKPSLPPLPPEAAKP